MTEETWQRETKSGSCQVLRGRWFGSIVQGENTNLSLTRRGLHPCSAVSAGGPEPPEALGGFRCGWYTPAPIPTRRLSQPLDSHLRRRPLKALKGHLRALPPVTVTWPPLLYFRRRVAALSQVPTGRTEVSRLSGPSSVSPLRKARPPLAGCESLPGITLLSRGGTSYSLLGALTGL